MVESYDPDELVTCPYDPVHRVQRKRMPYHIVKCKKNFESSGINFKTCPFNERHIVPRSEYSYHLEHCESKGRLAVQLKSNDDDRPKVVLKGNTDTPVTDWKPPDSSEDWEQEYAQPTFAQDSANDEDNTPQPVPKPRLPYSTSHIESISVLPRVPRQLPNGFGRGRGRVSSQLVGIMQDPAAKQRAQQGSPLDNIEVQYRMPAVSNATGNLGVGTEVNPVESNETDQGKDETLKQRRKLTKMLKQKIEEDQKQGHKLEQDQLSKLKRKDDVLLKLAQFQD
ncbi:hypothetical protein EMCRGX_G014824 [Ephydatia muelleri]